MTIENQLFEMIENSVPLLKFFIKKHQKPFL